jgi:hypothetical protein
MAWSSTKRPDAQPLFFSPTSYIAFLVVLCLAVSFSVFPGFGANLTANEHGTVKLHTGVTGLNGGFRGTIMSGLQNSSTACTNYLGIQATQDPLQPESTLLANRQPSSRHQAEIAHLNRRMLRENGVWGPSHPRYRLLDALFSYIRYEERNMAELERWRGLYRNVSKKQKQV